jgi:histidinol-phosphate aminotransferase
MAVKPLTQITAIDPYRGGESKLPGFDKPIKLASNENPFGAGERARAAFAEAARALHLYPDGAAAALREAIARRHGIDPERIVCGAGSDEIFQFLGRAYLAPGDAIVQSEHAFLVYRLVAQQAGATVLSAPDRNLRVDVDAMLALVTPKTRIVFLANPNNPTGTYLPMAEVRRLHAGLPPDVLFVIDAAYAEYVQRNDYEAGVELAGAADNVVMTRTFSKAHGLAALRVGWAFGPPGVIDALNRVRGPFNVSAPAQLAAVAALEDEAFLARSVAHNAAERARVRASLEAAGLHTTDSVGNFVLILFKDAAQAAAADAFLRSRGVIVRAMGAYGLSSTLRMSIGAVAENDAALEALKAFQAAQ